MVTGTALLSCRPFPKILLGAGRTQKDMGPKCLRLRSLTQVGLGGGGCHLGGTPTPPGEQIVATKHAPRRGGAPFWLYTRASNKSTMQRPHSPAGCARPIQLAGMAVSLSSGLWSPSTAARSSLGLSVTYQTRLTEQTQNPRWQDPSFI